MGMAVFADAFIEITGLSRTELSLAYMLGTISSALFLTRAGRFYDEYGPRLVLVSASLLLGASVIFISVVDVISLWLTDLLGINTIAVTFCLMVVGYFGVRFSGQGVMTSASRNMLLVWFERKRGLVSGVRGVIVSLGFSLAPLVLAVLIDVWEWRAALWWLAVVVGPGFALLCLLLIRDKPESCGLLADNQAPSLDRHEEQVVQRNFTLKEVRRNVVFGCTPWACRSMRCLEPPLFFISLPSLPRPAAAEKRHSPTLFLKPLSLWRPISVPVRWQITLG